MDSYIRVSTLPRMHIPCCLTFKRILDAVLSAIFIISSLCSTQSSGSTIPVMLGGNVVLTCPSHKPSAPDDVSWTGPGSGLVISTRGVQTAAGSDKSKYMVVPAGLTDTSSTLIIKRVDLQDDGVYRCLDADSSLELHAINVTVLVSVQTIQVTAPREPLYEGSHVTVVCTTDGSKPAPQIVWVKQESDRSVRPKRLSGRTTGDVVHVNGTVRRTSSLDVLVDRSDYLASYTCTATVSVFSRDVTWSPDVLLTPMSPWLHTSHAQYGDDDVAQFTCVTSGARPAARVTWLIRNQPISDLSVGQVSDQNREDAGGTFSTGSRLDVAVSRDMNGADVTCSVTNSVLRHQGEGPRNASVSIVVQYPPSVSITCSVTEAAEGHDVTFTCSTDAEPPVAMVRLTLNGRDVPERRTTRDGGRFVLHNVTRFDRGSYRCVAQNSRGTASSPASKLTVKFAPVCTTADIQRIYVRLGDTATLPCPVQAFPCDATVTWARSSTNQTLQRETTLLWSDDDVVESVMRYRVRSYEDITCYANNSVGPSSAPCAFRLAPPVPPSAPHGCLVNRLPNDSQRVLCSPGRDGGSPQAFFIRVRTSNRKDRVLRGAQRPRFILRGLEGDADFNLTVCSVSQSFPDRPACAEPLLLRTEASSIPASIAPEGEGSKLYVILGAVFGCCFVVIGTIVTIIVCRRRLKGRNSSRNREGRQEADNGRSQRWDGMEEGHAVIPDEHSAVSHDAPTPDRALISPETSSAAAEDRPVVTRVLLPAGNSSAPDRPEEKRHWTLSLRKSRSVSSVDIRFKGSTKVYIRMSKEEREKRERVAGGGSDVDGNGHTADTDDDDVFSTREDDKRQSVCWSQDGDRAAPRGNETTAGRHATQAPPGDAGSRRTNCGAAGEGRVGGRCARQRLSDPSSSRASFSDRIRRTLHRNRSFAAPATTATTTSLRTDAAPLVVSLLGPSHSPYYVWSPAPLSASRTSLASDKLGQSSDIYDVPKASADWQRAMSLLSLSAIGSGVLAPDNEKRDDYVDMTRGQRHGGGSVPDLDRAGEKNGGQAREEGDYHLMPSNKHAYVNLAYDGRPRGQPDSDGHHGHHTSTAGRHDANQTQRRARVNGKADDGSAKQPRRWSFSSERKTHELSPVPLSTATFLPPPIPRRSRFDSSRTSMKLSPAPQLKLCPERPATVAATPREECTATEHHHHQRQHPRDSSRPGTTRRINPPVDSPTYVRMERDPVTPDNVKYEDIAAGTTAVGRHGSGSGRGAGRRDAEHGARQLSRSAGDYHPRPPSIQRSPSSTRVQEETRERSHTNRGDNSSRREATRMETEANNSHTDTFLNDEVKGKNSSVTEASSRDRRRRNSRKRDAPGSEIEKETEGQFRWLPVAVENTAISAASKPGRYSSQTSIVSRESSF